MRQLIFILLTFFVLQINAMSRDEFVIVSHSGDISARTDIPKAYYSDDDGVLEIEFESDQEFYLEVSDENGNLVYCSTINTDGNANYFKLDLDQKHNYTITITSVNETYIGEIEAEGQ